MVKFDSDTHVAGRMVLGLVLVAGLGGVYTQFGSENLMVDPVKPKKASNSNLENHRC